MARKTAEEEIAAGDQEADERIAIPRGAWEEIIRAPQETYLLAAARA